MLMDMLGVLVGFATAMLLMSLIVTMLVQVLQDMLRLRGRALRKSIADVWKMQLKDQFARKEDNPENKGYFGAEVFKATSSILNKKAGRSNQPLLLEAISGPAASEITLEDFGAGELSETDCSEREEIFRRVEENSTRRFRVRIKLLTCIISILVAGYFQVSAPELLQTLSVNPEIRAKFENGADRALELYQASVSLPSSHEDVSSQALNKLADDYPEVAIMLEEVSGVDPIKVDLLQELSLVLEANGVPNRTAIVDSYQDNLDAQLSKRIADARQASSSAVNQLGVLGISPWSYGWDYYKDANRFLGVLITALLLSLGAPFWFEQLKNLAKLRDTFADARKQIKNDNHQVNGQT